MLWPIRVFGSVVRRDHPERNEDLPRGYDLFRQRLLLSNQAKKQLHSFIEKTTGNP